MLMYDFVLICSVGLMCSVVLICSLMLNTYTFGQVIHFDHKKNIYVYDQVCYPKNKKKETGFVRDNTLFFLLGEFVHGVTIKRV